MRTLRRIAVVALLATGLVGSACASNDEGERASVTTQASAVAVVGPDAFAARMDGAGVVTINVHVPDEGQIEGTDLTIPFDEISSSTALPADRSTPLALYCRSGNMSASAVRDLEALGYTDIVELDGGFNAWAESGRPLQPPAS